MLFLLSAILINALPTNHALPVNPTESISSYTIASNTSSTRYAEYVAAPPNDTANSSKAEIVDVDAKEKNEAAPVFVQPLSIVGGIAVNPPFKYSWLVSLQDSGFHFCGGSLINPTTIITAAHCSQIPVSSSLSVWAHRFKLSASASSEKALRFSVYKITAHPLYDDVSMKNDVAVWKVKLLSGDATLIPTGEVELDDGTYTLENTKLRIAGWGTIKYGGSPPGFMEETTVNVLPTSACKAEYSTLQSTSLCAAAPGKDTCQGDSGGPLFTIKPSGKVALVGLTSFGSGCADPNYAGVYTRISSLSNWLQPLFSI